MKQRKALLVNPFIYDFAAYNFWCAPLGLLSIGALLRENGVEIELIDCMTPNEAKRKSDGRSPFVKTRAEKPAALRNVRKPYRRYGMSPELLAEKLGSVEVPDIILVTSVLTYWYPGTKEVVEMCRRAFPRTPIVVGGIYPSLCQGHAQRALAVADAVVANRNLSPFYGLVERACGISFAEAPGPDDLDAMPFPAFDLYRSVPFVPLLASVGCVFRCAYCATPFLRPEMVRKDGRRIIAEIEHWHGRGISTFVLYDDNFLYGKEAHAKPLLRAIAALPFEISIYNPNALNADMVDGETARLLKAAGFREVRLGFETADAVLQRSLGGKTTSAGLEKALKALGDAGFGPGDVHGYVLAGLPLQRWQDVMESARYLSGLGVRIGLAEYTPIPHTGLFERFHRSARYPIAEEPLFQNNALLPFAWEGFREEDMEDVKSWIREANMKTGATSSGRAL